MAMEDGGNRFIHRSQYQYKSNTGRRCDKRAAYYYADYGLGSCVTYKYTKNLETCLQLPTVCNSPRQDLGMVSIRSPNWVTASTGKKYATTAQKHPAKWIFLRETS